MKELIDEIEKVKDLKISPTKWIGGLNKQTEEDEEEEKVIVENNNDNTPKEDQLEISNSEPVQILNLIPKNFFETLVILIIKKQTSSKWKERKEVLEILLPIVSVPKLNTDDKYFELITALSKVLNKFILAIF